MIFQIRAQNPLWRGIVSVRRASSPREALLAFFEETLKPRGYVKPRVTAQNLLTVRSKTDIVAKFDATSVKK
jgi:hypothetical protein